MSKRSSLSGPSGKEIFICLGRFSSEMSGGGKRRGRGRVRLVWDPLRRSSLGSRRGTSPFCRRSSLADATLTPCFAFSAFSLLSLSCFSCAFVSSRKRGSERASEKERPCQSPGRRGGRGREATLAQCTTTRTRAPPSRGARTRTRGLPRFSPRLTLTEKSLIILARFSAFETSPEL